MPFAAIYARFSTADQKETSIEDQVRRCREKAIEAGYEVKDELIFSDAGISGGGASLHKRTGYKCLKAAWEKGQFSALVVDEPSRLARDSVEMARVQELVEKTRVRLITADGVDSSAPNWQLSFSIMGALAAHFTRETRHRVIRGMIGQLERGFMVGDAAYGYCAVRVLDAGGEEIGTRWEIDPEEAAVMRRMYALRSSGTSYALIAKANNAAGAPPPRKARDGTSGYWRPGTVQRLFCNTIYRGVATWNGSACKFYQARRDGEVVQTVEYARPHLRLVEDETWYRCRPKTGTVPRGGCRHVFAGIVSCGVCGAKLSINMSAGTGSLHCPQCEQAKRVGGPQGFLGYASVKSVREALMHVLKKIFSEDLAVEYKARLQARLKANDTSELVRLKGELARSARACERLAKQIRISDQDDQFLQKEYRLAKSDHGRLSTQIVDVEAGLVPIDRAQVEEQLSIDPTSVLADMLEGKGAVAATRAALARVFPRIALVAKPDRWIFEYEIDVAAGVAFAVISDTKVIDDVHRTVRLRVSTGPHRPIVYRVEQLV